ncbi:LLM class flavin-dependent oxidoreductase [Actinokineospora diospyrosa]|uniref:Flavin-dependent oxidoreductase, luciferase family (Includes alkanesulfonate monooxygenase SsuD and methylene tetrahydromethanopterin reductase) n=1 Tax=Actinokineospora diospyrosa TaxID=103728 RepID=A0ABT1IFL3_9PSEU|nr:LLM class flavin-dependent oxidoreductase [Actinokineospora diospyrosa]MCP2271433.1 Flavin-dependent oxidoreductase, luciferase family (includes alkanesulfonate monooxygenase SsuD and methylene tetrahydromethanopterin reductase) [Actinokineospora diospyrosa]
MTTGPHLAVALDAAGWHPAAWRAEDARPRELLSAGHWVELVREAESAALDFVTIEDTLGPRVDPFNPSGTGTDQVDGHLDAVLVAARVAPLTSRIGLVPTAVVTHTEPFHLSKAIATLDYVSSGRAGVRVRVAWTQEDNRLFGRRDIGEVDLADAKLGDQVSPVSQLFDETADYVEVLRRLWDSWEDDAEIRDAATGRFVDRDKLHYIDFEGKWFSVKGPSITPRPPQGQPVVTSLAHAVIPYRLAARSGDVVYITPLDRAEAVDTLAVVRQEQAVAGRERDTLHVFGDLVVFLGETTQAAREHKARLDDWAGAEYASDTRVFVGTPAELADVLLDLHAAGLSGFRLRPAAIPHDLTAITRGLVPELRSRGAFRTDYEASTLRGLLGLGRPANRYAAV